MHQVMKNGFMIFAGMLVASVLLFGYYGSAYVPEFSPHDVTISVTGLPPHLQALASEIVRAPNGQYTDGRRLGKVGEGSSLTARVEAPIVALLPVQVGPYSYYEAVKANHRIEPTTDNIDAKYVLRHRVDVGIWSRSAAPEGTGPRIHSRVNIEPARGPHYDHGSTITLEATVPKGALFGWWIVKAVGESRSLSDFTSADRTLNIQVVKPLDVTAAIVSEWFRYPSGKIESKGITITLLIPGQRVRLMDGESVVLEGMLIGRDRLILELPPGVTALKGSFEVTAPDGETVVYRSPVYDDLKPGDAFAY